VNGREITDQGERMPETATTAIELLTDYDPRKFNIISPIILSEERQSPYLAQSVSVVQINAGSLDTYNDWRYAKADDGKFALSAVGLTKLINAAGGKWIPSPMTDVLDQGTEMGSIAGHPFLHKWIRYQAAIAIRQLNGEWHVEPAQKDIDTRFVAEELFHEKLETLKRSRKPNYRGKRLNYTEDDIPDLVLRDMLRIRNDLLPLAETKAKNRAIRRILTVPQVFTKEELAKPFAMPQLVYRPDLTDPAQLEQVQIEGAKAAASIFGGPELPGHGSSGPAAEVPPTTGALAASVSQTTPQPVEPVGEQSGAGVTDVSNAGHGSREGAGETSAPDTSSPPVGEPAASGSAASQLSEPESAGNTPPKPTSDPEITSGPYKGRRFSEIAAEDPSYMAGLAEETKVNMKRRLIDEWLVYATGLNSAGESA
jgi:hypothetical protein